MAVTSQYAFKIFATETVSGDGFSSQSLVHADYDETGTLSSSSAAPITKIVSKLVTLTTGAYTIDLTTITGTNGVAQDGTGLKVQMIRVKNLGANNMTFSEGASNGLSLFGSSWSKVVYPSGVWQEFLNEGSPDIASGDRTIDVAGTGSQTFELTVLMG